MEPEPPQSTTPRRPRPAFALHGWAGLTLVATSWPASWLLTGLRTHILFVPLWLGFALTVDALVLARTGTSIIRRSPRDFVLLIAISAPAWWIFELFNLRTGNWIYLGREHFSDAVYFGLATLSFSTVIPAVFEASELVASYLRFPSLGAGRALEPTPRGRTIMVSIGLASAVLVIAWPDVFYPLVWGIVLFVTEPINQKLGRPSLFRYLRLGDWRPIAWLALGSLLCGFLWEFWNYYSYPKWVYRTPGVEFAHLFEMPALGFLGYLPFGLELWVLASLVLGREVVTWRGPAQR